jgi:hypothetical protein
MFAISFATQRPTFVAADLMLHLLHFLLCLSSSTSLCTCTGILWHAIRWLGLATLLLLSLFGHHARMSDIGQALGDLNQASAALQQLGLDDPTVGPRARLGFGLTMIVLNLIPKLAALFLYAYAMDTSDIFTSLP